MVDGKKKKEQCMEKGQVAMPIHHGPYQHGCGVVTCDLSRWPTLSQYILTYILVVTLWSLCDRASLCYLFPLHVAEVWYSHIGCIKSLGIQIGCVATVQCVCIRVAVDVVQTVFFMP